MAMTAAIPRYAAAPGIPSRSRSTLDKPKPTIQASKLMQIRRKVSGAIL